MPTHPRPFSRTARQAWFVQVAGKQINLGPDRAALSRYHELMRRPAIVGTASERVVVLLDAFLDRYRGQRIAHRRLVAEENRPLLDNPELALRRSPTGSGGHLGDFESRTERCLEP